MKPIYWLIVACVLVLALLAGLALGANASGCTGTVTGKWYFYNRYTLSLHGNHYDAHLYGGLVAGARIVNWCNSRLAYHYGTPRLYYPLGGGLWVSKNEINLRK